MSKRKGWDGGSPERAHEAAEGALRDKLVRQLLMAERAITEAEERDVFVRDIRLVNKLGLGSGWLAVVRAETDGGKFVAFHGGDTYLEAVSGVIARLRNGSLKWREDTPYEG
jgi:hypothetical protein